nr:hypothetical protein TetV2_00443 [Oceanusvirus sp.]
MAGASENDQRKQTVQAMSAAMKRQMDAEPSREKKHVPPEEVLRIAKMMQAYEGSAVERAEVFARMHPDFMEQCPALFQMACRTGMDMGMLEFMVGAATAHDEEDAKEMVGAKLMQRYVKD